ncbi:MAG: hypothetical protein EBU90_19590 [Proteobacteria bacterium]|nr:hypothetical protein [Pseudomonadota bacterium]NBP16943.1 hypothetical protein [bacterium]
MFLTQDVLVGIYASSSSSVAKVQLTNFSVTTTSGTIQVDWGDGFFETLTSGVAKNHSFSCPASPGPAGFWSNIEPCL